MKMNLVAGILLAIATGCVGFILGSIKFFREEKQKAYRESLPPIIKMAFDTDRTKGDEEEFNKALAKFWLYGNKGVTKKIDKVASILVNPKRGDLTRSVQEAIIEMRRDIRIKGYQGLKPEEVAHMYAKIAPNP